MNQNEIFEKIEKIESELQSLKSMIKTFTENTEYTPANVLNLPAKFPVDVVEEENGKIIDIFPESYDTEEFDMKDGVLYEYLGESEEVTIPYGIKKIGKRAFRKNQTIKKVNIPDTVTEIDDYAFSDCGHLKRLRCPENTKRIGMMAFNRCPELRISIPATCEYVTGEFYSFMGCKNVVTREVEK